jgi:hypothetical protein
MSRQGNLCPQAPRRTPIYNAMHGGRPPDDVLTMLAIEDVRERLGLSYEAIAKAEQHMAKGMHYSPTHYRV